jgi:hypothetical protein
MSEISKSQNTPLDQGGNAELLQSKYSTIQELQFALTSELKTQFVRCESAENGLTCPKCLVKSPKNIKNHGLGGGPLQHNTKSIQLLCKACGAKSRPNTVFEASGLVQEKANYEKTLAKFQTLAAEINKPIQKQHKISSYFDPLPETIDLQNVAEMQYEPPVVEETPPPNHMDTTMVETIQSLTKQVSKLQKENAEKDTKIEYWKNQCLSVVEHLNRNGNNTNTSTPVPKTKISTVKKQVKFQQNENSSDENSDNEWSETLYSSRVKRNMKNPPIKNSQHRMSEKAINRMANRTNAERIDLPKEFIVKHIELNNNADLSRLVKARNYEAVDSLLKSIIKKYDIKKEVIRYSRIGKKILEIYIAADDADVVETKVLNSGGHFDDDMKPGIIPPETLKAITQETSEFIAKCIVTRAARQFLQAPTLNFKKAVIKNYEGPFLKHINNEILVRKENMSPAPKGTRWLVTSECVFYQSKIIENTTEKQTQDGNTGNQNQVSNTTANKRDANGNPIVDNDNMEGVEQDKPAESATIQC